MQSPLGVSVLFIGQNFLAQFGLILLMHFLPEQITLEGRGGLEMEHFLLLIGILLVLLDWETMVGVPQRVILFALQSLLLLLPTQGLVLDEQSFHPRPNEGLLCRPLIGLSSTLVLNALNDGSAFAFRSVFLQKDQVQLILVHLEILPGMDHSVVVEEAVETVSLVDDSLKHLFSVNRDSTLAHSYGQIIVVIPDQQKRYFEIG